MANASNNNGEHLPIDVEMFQYLVTGNADGFRSAMTRLRVDNVLKLRCARDHSTILHIAAMFGQLHLINQIVNQWPHLMLEQNSFGDLPIHSAIKTGRFDSVEAMISRTNHEVLGCTNNEDNTPLHNALELYDEKDEHIVERMVDLYPGACYVMNKQGICPLYLGIKRELPHMVQYMLDRMHYPSKDDALECLMAGQSVLHAAVSATTSDMLEKMLCYDVRLTKLVNKEGWTALSYAASMQYIDKVQILNCYDPISAFISSNNQTFPIHVAMLGGHPTMVDSLTNLRVLRNAKGQNIFHLAALSGDYNIISCVKQNLSDIEVLINQKDEDGNTPLHLATQYQQIEVVEILIQNEKVNVGLLNKQGLTAFDLANNIHCQKLKLILERARNGIKYSSFNEDLYRSLVNWEENKAGIDQIVFDRGIQYKDLVDLEDGSSILHIAARMGKHQLVKHLLESDPGCGELMEQANNKGDLPIHLAAKWGELRCLENLRQYWFNNYSDRDRIFRRQNMEGNTALHVAVQNNHKTVAIRLCEFCPEAAYYLNNNKICPLFLAITNGNHEKDVVDIMIEVLQNNTQFIQKHSVAVKSVIYAVIQARKIANLKILIEYAKELFKDSFDDKGRNPLSYATCIGCVEVVQLLLEKFPALEFKRDINEDGYFPIHHAAKVGHIKIVKMLHLSTFLLNNKQQNILHVAAGADKYFVVSYLLQKKNHFNDILNTSDEDGNTPLHLAAKGCYPGTMFYLMRQKNIDINSINNELFTARDIFESGWHCPSDPDEHLKLKLKELKQLWRKADEKNSVFREEVDEAYDGKEVNEKAVKHAKVQTWSQSIHKETNILLVVATLIISVTYSSTFSPPGGYNQDTGEPILKSSLAFKIFTNLNGLACFYTLVAAVMLIVLEWIPYFLRIGKLFSMIYLCVGLMFMIVGYAAGWTSIAKHSLLNLGWIQKHPSLTSMIIGAILWVILPPISFWAFSKTMSITFFRLVDLFNAVGFNKRPLAIGDVFGKD